MTEKRVGFKGEQARWPANGGRPSRSGLEMLGALFGQPTPSGWAKSHAFKRLQKCSMVSDEHGLTFTFNSQSELFRVFIKYYFAA